MRSGYADQPVIWQGSYPHGPMSVGRGNQKCGAVGCVITSVAMALRYLGVRAGATPTTVQTAGLARPGVWAPGASGCVVPELVRAQTGLAVGVDADGPGIKAPVDRLSPLILDTLAGGGVALLSVDYDAGVRGGDSIGDHWVCAYAADDDWLYLADPATAKVEKIDRTTLAATVMWGRRRRPYVGARAVTVFRD
jgi:hypothetical protein